MEYLNFLAETYAVNFVKYFGYFFICIILLHSIIKLNKFLGLVDIPNNRSFHRIPTPSGGGIAIVLIILISNYKYIDICPEFFIGAFLISIVGLVDDIKALPVFPRLLCQMMVIGSMVVFLPTKAPIMGIHIYIIKTILFFAGVWFINIYNFMDGIDGLAGGYANAAAVGFLYCIQNTLLVEQWNLDIYNQLIYVTMAFLIFNWSPARIFMGDTGSTFLGFTFFSLGVRSLVFGNYIIYSFVIIMSFFWIDATITLARHLKLRSGIFKAHKEHAFHKAAAIFGHWKVSLFIIIFTLIWLNPMAKYAVTNVHIAPLITLAAILPVLSIILVFNPGAPDYKDNFIIRYFNKTKEAVKDS
jgi:Fuc2NAc and GlcNAc transferase